jgi:predicted peptidase
MKPKRAAWTLGVAAVWLGLSACYSLEPRRALDPLARPIYEPRHFRAPGGVDLPYRLYMPPGVHAPGSLPMLLLLHSITERGNDNGSNLAFFQPMFKEAFFEAHPCIAVVPQCPAGAYWWDKAVNASVVGLVPALAQEFPALDSSRLYVTGASLGGYATYGLLKVEPDWWAAAVPVCGDPSPVGLDLAKLKDQPLWIFHGAKDPRVPVKGDRELVSRLRAIGAPVHYREYPDLGHVIWTNAYQEPGLWDWVFSQRRLVGPDLTTRAKDR